MLVVVVGISLTRSFLTTPVYRATASVLLQPRSTDSLFNPSTGVRKRPGTGRRHRDPDPQERTGTCRGACQARFRAPVSAAGVGSTDVIGVSATSTKPAVAADTANAYTNAYIDFGRKQAVDDLLAAGSEIQTKIDQLQKKIDDLDAQINAVPRPR